MVGLVLRPQSIVSERTALIGWSSSFIPWLFELPTQLSISLQVLQGFAVTGVTLRCKGPIQDEAEMTSGFQAARVH